ncbi:MAG: response regulator [Cyanobacteria bacterium P01_F01_bin.150]
MTLSNLQTLSSPFIFLTEWHRDAQDGLFKLVSQNQIIWHIAILNNCVHYATHSVQTIKTLEFYLQRLGYVDAIAPSQKLFSAQASCGHERTQHEQGSGSLYLWVSTHVQQLAIQNVLSPYQANRLMDEMCRDSIEVALWSTSGSVQRISDTVQSSLSIWDGVPLDALVQMLRKRQQTWHSIADYIQSPYQRPYCINVEQIDAAGAKGALPIGTLKLLVKLMIGRSIRQLAQVLKQDELKFAQLLYPYVKRGIIGIQAPVAPLDQLPLAFSEQAPEKPPSKSLPDVSPNVVGASQTPVVSPEPLSSPKPVSQPKPILPPKSTAISKPTAFNPTVRQSTPTQRPPISQPQILVPHQPADDQVLEPVSKEPTRLPPQKLYKIVCIDDNATMLEMLEEYLEHDCFEVTTVVNPMQSISALFAAHPDLVLMDVSMPGINGHRLCQILKRSSAFKTTPIIMVSGNTGVLDKTKAKAMGATDYLEKPFSQDDLLKIIGEYLQI